MKENLKQFICNHGDDNKQQRAKLAPTRIITLEPGDEGPHGQNCASCHFREANGVSLSIEMSLVYHSRPGADQAG